MSATLDEADMEVKTPMKRLGSTRKLLVFNNIRLQLNEQLKCLDARVEAQAALAGELQDYFRRRADVEADYSRGLDKLARTLQLRHKEQKHKREQWPLFSSYACWQQLVGATRALSRDHAALADLYGTRLVARFQTVAEDVQRLYRRCREIGYETHEEILRVLGELHAAMKTHQQYAGEWRAAVAKLRAAHAQRMRALPNPRTKKMKIIDKEIDKRRVKHAEAKLKALKARSEYLLCLEAANTTIHKYFVDDLSDLIDCMDLGFHNCISRALRMQASADEGRARALQQSADTLYGCIDALDSRLDKQKFLEAHHQAFMIPRKLSYQGQQPEEEDAENVAEISNGTTDESPKNESETIQSSAMPGPAPAPAPPCEPDEVEAQLKAEMEARLGQLEARVRALRAESSEACKTLETAEATLLQMVESEEWDTSNLFGTGSSQELQPSPASSAPAPAPQPPQPEQIAIKARADRHETEEFYLTKFREYLVGSGRIARLESKAGLLRSKVGSAPLHHTGRGPSTPLSCIPRHRRRLGAGRGGSCGATPRLFAAPLEEHLEAVRRELPLVVTSCIRVINLYGLQHQGIFRVSGSQVEIATLREWFERGEDPLAGVSDASDINSVAGLLKLYLRELRPPLVPIIYFDHLVELSQLESKCDFVHKMREFVLGLPRCSMVLLRYLFAFLNHLSEFSEENMMDPWNLAICFGPTLVPVPEDKDQVQYQNQVNDLIKNIIILHEGIFPRDDGPLYEKYQTLQVAESEDVSQDALAQDDVDSETSIYASEDECTQSASVTPSGTPLLDEMDPVNAIVPAIWGWKARSNKELSVRPGDKLEVLARRAGGYLVRCLLTAREGFVPDSCLVLDHRGDELVLRKSPAPAPASLPSGSVAGDAPRPASSPPATWPRPEMQSGDSESGAREGEGAEQCTRRSHAKSHSVGDVAAPAQFSLNKELWQQRASCQLKHTPDLVMDLPAKAILTSEGGEVSEEGADSPTNLAERFVQNQNNTLKKRSTHCDAETVDKEAHPSTEQPVRASASAIESSVEGLPAVMEKSPVPPRNTRRVAAKFADLTLTGGSLKPHTPIPTKVIDPNTPTPAKVSDLQLKPLVSKGIKPALLPRPPAIKTSIPHTHTHTHTDNTQL